MPDSFLHERSDFKALVATVADSEKINDPALQCWKMKTDSPGDGRDPPDPPLLLAFWRFYRHTIRDALLGAA